MAGPDTSNALSERSESKGLSRVTPSYGWQAQQLTAISTVRALSKLFKLFSQVN